MHGYLYLNERSWGKYAQLSKAIIPGDEEQNEKEGIFIFLIPNKPDYRICVNSVIVSSVSES